MSTLELYVKHIFSDAHLNQGPLMPQETHHCKIHGITTSKGGNALTVVLCGNIIIMEDYGNLHLMHRLEVQDLSK